MTTPELTPETQASTDAWWPSDSRWQDRPHDYQPDHRDGVSYSSGVSCPCGRAPGAALHTAEAVAA